MCIRDRFKAIRDYDDTKETSFFHFAELCITRQLYKAVEASNRKKHAPLNSYVSFYSENSENGYPLAETLTMDGIGNPEQMMIDQENVAQFWEKLRTHLSKMEREVLDLSLIHILCPKMSLTALKLSISMANNACNSSGVDKSMWEMACSAVALFLSLIHI